MTVPDPTIQCAILNKAIQNLEAAAAKLKKIKANIEDATKPKATTAEWGVMMASNDSIMTEAVNLANNQNGPNAFSLQA